MTYEEDQKVLVRYPLTQAQEEGPRAAWPWVPGYIVRECGDNEWEVCLTDPRLVTEDGDGEQGFPTCFRDSSELRKQVDQARDVGGPARRRRWGRSPRRSTGRPGPGSPNRGVTPAAGASMTGGWKSSDVAEVSPAGRADSQRGRGRALQSTKFYQLTSPSVRARPHQVQSRAGCCNAPPDAPVNAPALFPQAGWPEEDHPGAWSVRSV